MLFLVPLNVRLDHVFEIFLVSWGILVSLYISLLKLQNSSIIFIFLFSQWEGEADIESKLWVTESYGTEANKKGENQSSPGLWEEAEKEVQEFPEIHV